MSSKTKIVRIPGQRNERLAKWIYKHHPQQGLEAQAQAQAQASASTSPTSKTDTHKLKVVCISDTHDHQPALPPGDILIHAGDLTENGSFAELQAQLDWLSAQPHTHKIVVAGNHDVILDSAFLEKYPERRYGDARTSADLQWGSVTYLQDSSVTLHFASADTAEPTRELNLFGSPRTPQYGISAFQYPRDEDIWASLVPDHTDILVVHGPARLYVDETSVHHAGCPYLAQRIAQVRPRMVVCGHIHVAHGRQDVVLDRSRVLYDELLNRWGGWATVVQLAVAVSVARLGALLSQCRGGRGHEKGVTTFVNASMVGGPRNELMREATVMHI